VGVGTRQLQEVVRSGPPAGRLLVVGERGSLEDLVVGLEVLVELQDGGHIPTAIAIVRGGPDGHNGVVEHELVALHDELVSPGNQGQAVGRIELENGGERNRG